MKRTLSITLGILAMATITIALITMFTATTKAEYGMSVLALVVGFIEFMVFIKMENQLNNPTKY